jgi:hypothetical protein
MGIRNYIITVDAGMPMAELAERLREAGFEVVQQLEAVGVIVGRVDDADLPRIQAVRGVSALEEERSIEPRSSGG